MPSKFVWLFAAIALLSSRVQAASDVAYQLELPAQTASTDGEMPKLGSIEFKDRQWSLAGIEEADQSMPPAWPLRVPATFRLEFRPDSSAPKASYLMQDQHFSVEPAPTIAGDLWPRTREMFSHPEDNDFSLVICGSPTDSVLLR